VHALERLRYVQQFVLDNVPNKQHALDIALGLAAVASEISQASHIETAHRLEDMRQMAAAMRVNHDVYARLPATMYPYPGQ
jgi:hypothetical protein